MSKYIGLTIGPIYDTMSTAKKTKELWGASYIFSYMMKKLIGKFKDDREFVIPYTKDEKKFTDKLEIGLFHDRFIFKSEEGDFEKLKEEIKNLLNKISESIEENNRNKVYEYLKAYFNIHYIELELEKDVIIEMNEYLDIMELDKNFVYKETNNYLKKLFENNDNSFLKKDAFGEENFKVPSIPEIAVGDILNEKEKKMFLKNDNVIKEAKKRKNFKNCNKYIAVVQADGDNIGEIIRGLSGQEDYEKFSKMLFDFTLEANEIIKDYGGITIYGGGDDLLFFTPIINCDKNILDIVDKLSELFNKKVELNFDTKKLKKKPSMSFGISIAYNKHPLKEILKKAGSLLFKDAKDKKIGKNAIAMRVLKHSGQYFDIIMNKDKKIYKDFKTLLEEFKDEKLLTSITYKLQDEKFILKEIINDKERVKNYFNNTLNEDKHKKEDIKKYIDAVVDLIITIFKEFGNVKENEKDKEFEKRLNVLFSCLRFLKFITDKRGDDDE